MTAIRRELRVDVTDAVGHGDGLEIAATVVAPPTEELPPRPVVVVATPGGTYNRRYWDMQPPGRVDYSQAAYLAEHGVIVVACDYLGGGDSSRPDDADFIGLEAQADAAHGAFVRLGDGLRKGTLTDALAPISRRRGGGDRTVARWDHHDHPTGQVRRLPRHRDLRLLTLAVRRRRGG